MGIQSVAHRGRRGERAKALVKGLGCDSQTHRAPDRGGARAAARIRPVVCRRVPQPAAARDPHVSRGAGGRIGTGRRAAERDRVDPVKAVAIGTEAEAAQRIREGTDSAALIVSTAGTTDTLLVAQAGGNAVATAVTTVITEAESAQHRSLAVRDIVPLQPGDGHGLTGFYLVIGWIIGGYLVSAALGVAKGSRPSTPGRALVRLSALVPYAIVSGFAGALIVDRGLHALTGHFLALSLLGVLLVAVLARSRWRSRSCSTSLASG